MDLSISAELFGKGQEQIRTQIDSDFGSQLNCQLIMTLGNTLHSQFLIYKIGTILITPVLYGYCKD